MKSELKRQTAQTTKLDQIIPACAAKRSGAAGRWATLEDIGYGV